MRLSRLSLALVLLAAVAAAAVVLLGRGPFGTGAPPSDAAMLAHFETQRAGFEALAAMLAEDRGLRRFGADWSDPPTPAAAGVTADRLVRYRRLCDRLGIVSVVNLGDRITLVHHASGLGISGSGKSFVRGPAAPWAEVVTGDLDAAARDAAQAPGGRRRGAILERRIDADWWLQLDPG
ncbi:hypothetical protein CCR97_01885 [Rhodoplanes elegans]|uniref:Uncharacterized protein n=1 Tax=Rhodoplanes elegans TaxID=29408 RepID=A0A327KGG2_9BRAD|nr:hypothetical protein [Rhodoplanes elegans]MBK5956970.1 hypothetical protein [Rhodoplanes elegans]RAI37497.1 hypothetical protein CH338_15935 [Rhodoplanes elegans]